MFWYIAICMLNRSTNKLIQMCKALDSDIAEFH